MTRSTQRLAPLARSTIFQGQAPARRVLITGASRGLGLELARQCLALGDKVFAGARSPEQSEGLFDLGQAHGASLTLVKLDITEPRSIDAAMGQIAAASMGLDLLINNAGINAMSRDMGDPARYIRLGALEAEALTEVFRVNAVGPLIVTQSARALLKMGATPKVINITSWQGSLLQNSRGGNYAYAASKTALNMISRTLAFDLAEDDIIVAAINPGWVRTDMGGPNAPLTPQQAIEGILRVVDGLKAEDSGCFLQWDGTAHPW